MGRPPRAPSSVDVAKRVFHGSGLAWLTPFVGKQDSADFEYLRSSIVRDLAWVDALLDEDPDNKGLARVALDLAALLGEARKSTVPSVLFPIRFAWHVPSGWTDYGGIRLALLAALPVDALSGALVELRSAEALVLAGSRAKWSVQLAALEAVVADPVKAADKSVRHKLQALWREIDFGRNYWRVRVAKNTTITSVTWALIVVATILTAMTIAKVDAQDRANAEAAVPLATTPVISAAGSANPATPAGSATSENGSAGAPASTAGSGSAGSGSAGSAAPSGSGSAGSSTPSIGSGGSGSAKSHIPEEPVNIWFVVLLGLLGGSISALRSTNLISIAERRPIEVEAVRLRLRPVVGAAMALVLYVIGHSALVFELMTAAGDRATTAHAAPIQIHVPSIAWGFYALAFLAGFSERWFLQILELTEARFEAAPAPAPKPIPHDPPPPSPPGAAKPDPAKPDPAKPGPAKPGPTAPDPAKPHDPGAAPIVPTSPPA